MASINKTIPPAYKSALNIINFSEKICLYTNAIRVVSNQGSAKKIDPKTSEVKRLLCIGKNLLIGSLNFGNVPKTK
jgi:hypothetical protein